MRARGTILGLLILGLATVPRAAERAVLRQDSLSLRQGKAAMWRSVALDGWGQAYNGEWLKAALFSGAEVAMLAGAYGQQGQFEDWDRKRRQATDASLQEYYGTRADFYLRDRNKILWWWLWLKLGSVLDAYVSGSLSNFDAGWEGLGLEPDRLGNGAAVLRLTLPLPETRRHGWQARETRQP